MTGLSSYLNQHVFTVSEVSQDLKQLVSDNFASVWIKGEVSGVHHHASGHVYFDLKDKNALLRAVMFRGSVRHLRFKIENGLSLIAHGSISIYEPRSTYQLIVDRCEPDGIGALQLAFEQLKTKLKAEGLFEPERKRPLPLLPRRIGLVTSISGAVLHDMITVLKRRFPNIDLLIYPVPVQGPEAAPAIAQAIEWFGQNRAADVLIVGRGGGSMEDLWAFNEEIVVRALAASPIPVISAVGHETDVTLADFAADLRAPTPSAAAELAVPVKQQWLATFARHRQHLLATLESRLLKARRRLSTSLSRLPTPQQSLDRARLHLADLEDRLLQTTHLRLRDERLRLAEIRQTLQAPGELISQAHNRLDRSHLKLQHSLTTLMTRMQTRLSRAAIRLPLLDPLKPLSRGYTIVSHTDGRVITRGAQLTENDSLLLRFADGQIRVRVEPKTH